MYCWASSFARLAATTGSGAVTLTFKTLVLPGRVTRVCPLTAFSTAAGVGGVGGMPVITCSTWGNGPAFSACTARRTTSFDWRTWISLLTARSSALESGMTASSLGVMLRMRELTSTVASAVYCLVLNRVYRTTAPRIVTKITAK